MMKKLLIGLVGAALLSGCTTQTFKISNSGQANASLDKQDAFFVYGLGQENVIDAAGVCGGAENVAKIQSEHTFVNGLLAGITQGLYTPRQARVFCK